MWKCLSCKIIWILRILFFNVFVYFYDCYVVSNVCIVCFCLGCYKMRSWKRHEIDPQHHLLLFPLEKERVWNNLENSFFMTLHHYFFYASQTQTSSEMTSSSIEYQLVRTFRQNLFLFQAGNESQRLKIGIGLLIVKVTWFKCKCWLADIQFWINTQ